MTVSDPPRRAMVELLDLAADAVVALEQIGGGRRRDSMVGASARRAGVSCVPFDHGPSASPWGPPRILVSGRGETGVERLAATGWAAGRPAGEGRTRPGAAR